MQSSREDKLNELWWIYITEYFIVIKKNEMFLSIPARKNFKTYVVLGRNEYIA